MAAFKKGSVGSEEMIFISFASDDSLFKNVNTSDGVFFLKSVEKICLPGNLLC
jgi:hypothetical protein